MLTKIFTNFIKTGNHKNLPLRLRCPGTFVPPLKVLTFFPVNRGVEGLLFSLNSNIFDSKTFISNLQTNVFGLNTNKNKLFLEGWGNYESKECNSFNHFV